MSKPSDRQTSVLPASLWVIGLDLRPESQGPVKFAAWIARSGQTVDQFVAVHVLEDAHVAAAKHYTQRDAIFARAAATANTVLADAGVAGVAEDLEIVEGEGIDGTLEAFRKDRMAHGIIVARHAHKHGRHIFRLGGVARRLLRTLASPVIVVPPDFDPAGDTTAQGPVICAVSLAKECESAVEFARRAALRWERPLVLAHVVATPDDYGASYIPAEALDRVRTEHEATAARNLDRFAQSHNVGDCEQVVLPGSVVESLVELASARHACLLVTGSRRLSTLERILLTSVGSDLAASAHRPVAVIPPAADSEAPPL